MTSRRILGIFLLGLGLCGVLACGGPDAPASSDAPGPRRAASSGSTPPSIVLISIDTLRSDRLPAYGYTGVDTPAIDTLARRGWVFERAYAHSPLTKPSHASILTGLLPPDHGVRDNIGYRLESHGLAYLPRLLRDAGYATAAAVSALVLQGQGGFDDGFEVYDDALGPRGRSGAGGVQRSGADTLEAVLPWLRQRGPDEPFFLFLHLFEPHTPYAPPEPFASRYPDPYDGEIATADAVVGKLLAELEALGLDPAVVLLSDHGEGLGDHGEAEHGVLLYREALQVPLIIAPPQGAEVPPRRVPGPVGLVDVMPTLLDLAGLPRPDGLAGRTFLDDTPPVAEDGATRPIYAETFFPRLHFGWSELTSIIDGSDHYIHGPDPELYDLEADPQESDNRVRDDRATARRLRQTLADFERPLDAPAPVSAEERRALAALGYVGSTAGTADGPLPDPKTRLHTVEDLKDCLRDYASQRLESALDACRRAVEVNPKSLDGWEYLGRTAQELGQRRGALEAYARALQLAEGRAGHLAVASALLWLAEGQPQNALALLAFEIPRTAESRPLRLLEARTLAQVGQLDAALGRVESLVVDHPDDPDAIYLRGAIRLGRGDVTGAESDLGRALDLAPGHTAALSDLAVLHERQGRRDEALRLYRRVLDLRPGDPLATAGVGRLQ